VSLKFYMDANVPYAITHRLRTLAVDVLTAQEDGADEMSDEDMLDRADALGREVFTHDQDFLVLAAERQDTGRELPGIFFAQHLPGRNRQYADNFMNMPYWENERTCGGE
jgi:hypothetical protein